jgi:hypothetical protein
MTMHMTPFFIGIDVQFRRGCSYAVIDGVGTLVDSGWLSDPVVEAVNLAKKFNISGPAEVGIDAPRMPLIQKRQWYWEGNKRRWKLRGAQSGYGRHCEVVLKADNIANPQWTPLEGEAPEWMKLGFKLYLALKEIVRVHEVFSTASYALLDGVHDVRLDIDFSACRPGPKDMLDAWVAASTVREFTDGRGCEVGGGDGLGTIILPKPLTEILSLSN